MKRAGKLFLVVVLVLSMFWTSTGTSNVLGVFAENSAAIQSVEEDKEAKTGAEGKDSDIENTGESTAASKTTQETTSKKEETTTQEASTEAKKKKEEVTTQEKKAESTTTVKKKTAKSKITTQDAVNAATEGINNNSLSQKAAKAAEVNIEDCITNVDMSVTINGKKIALKWKKNTSGTGYQIQYATDKKFKKECKTKTISKNKTTSYTIKSLKKKKTYYVRIRTYKKLGNTYYSGWSSAKKVKINK